ncbi:GNAT family N-acetyltransferase [Micromonospora sp. CA-263727]|uniref:GNAT family N-acetyltransferase n=1 Tax=Micromonospora sp. CA-263727 TaxID=3239967 RepID=UPI003D8F36F6
MTTRQCPDTEGHRRRRSDFSPPPAQAAHPCGTNAGDDAGTELPGATRRSRAHRKSLSTFAAARSTGTKRMAESACRQGTPMGSSAVMLTRTELLALHDQQVRGTIASRLPGSWRPSWDGPVLQVATPARGFAFAQDLDGLTVEELDALIGRVRNRSAARGQAVEWKTYGHDRRDLPARLQLAGFAPEDEETVVIGLAADLIASGEAPDGITVRATTDLTDLRRIAAMESEVWGADWSWLADDLHDRICSAAENIVVLVAEAAGEVVSAAWLVILPGTQFAALWGGSTLRQWRGKGIYRTLVARRAQIATDRGITYLLVDASTDSRPILQRLGLHPVTTTTPWVWSPTT